MFQQFLHALNLAQIGGKTACVTPLIPTTATQYSSGDCVGGIIQLKGAMSRENGTGIIKSIVVKDNLNQKSALTLLFFNALPTGMTSTDNSAFVYGTTAFYQQVAKVNIASADYETINSKAVLNLDAISTAVQAVGSTDLYMIIVTTGTPTYAADSASLSITISLLQD